MTHLTLVKTDTGELDGFTERDVRAWRKFGRKRDQMEPGELLDMEVWFPRDPAFHKYHFKVLKGMLEAQEQFHELDAFRRWCYVGAGYADFVPGPFGREIAIPKSIAWSKIDDADFRELHDKVVAFLRSEHAGRFLWGHLSTTEQMEVVEAVMVQFERPQEPPPPAEDQRRAA